MSSLSVSVSLPLPQPPPPPRNSILNPTIAPSRVLSPADPSVTSPHSLAIADPNGLLQHAIEEENWKSQNRSIVRLLLQLDDENDALFNEITEAAMGNAESLYVLLQERVSLLKERQGEKSVDGVGVDSVHMDKQAEILRSVKMLLDEGSDSVEDFLNAMYRFNAESSRLFMGSLDL
jgi:hypothetical protein